MAEENIGELGKQYQNIPCHNITPIKIYLHALIIIILLVKDDILQGTWPTVTLPPASPELFVTATAYGLLRFPISREHSSASPFTAPTHFDTRGIPEP